MQVSIKWLNDYIKFNETAEELADKYTMSGVPVENVIRADEGLDKVSGSFVHGIELLLFRISNFSDVLYTKPGLITIFITANFKRLQSLAFVYLLTVGISFPIVVK